MLTPRTLDTWTTNTARATPTHGAQTGTAKGIPRDSPRFFPPAEIGLVIFACCIANECSISVEHGNRCTTEFQPPLPRRPKLYEFSACGKASRILAEICELGARQTTTRARKLYTENSIRFTCLASGTKNIPFQLRSRAPISSYEAASAQRTLLENFYSATRFDTCMRLTRCAHTCIQNISKSTFFF